MTERSLKHQMSIHSTLRFSNGLTNRLSPAIIIPCYADGGGKSPFISVLMQCHYEPQRAAHAGRLRRSYTLVTLATPREIDFGEVARYIQPRRNAPSDYLRIRRFSYPMLRTYLKFRSWYCNSRGAIAARSSTPLALSYEHDPAFPFHIQFLTAVKHLTLEVVHIQTSIH